MLFTTDPKTKKVAHYIISNTQPDRLGATKLNKVMWRADVEFYRKHGRTITGQSSYVRMPKGPVPNYIKDALAELRREQKIIERSADTPVGSRREFFWLVKQPASDFSAEEVEAIHNAIDVVCRRSASTASNDTHDALWKEIEDGRQIPVRAAAVIPGELEPDDIEWAFEAARTTG